MHNRSEHFELGLSFQVRKLKKENTHTQKKDSRTSLELFCAANRWKKTPNIWTMTKFWTVKKLPFCKGYSRKQKDLKTVIILIIPKWWKMTHLGLYFKVPMLYAELLLNHMWFFLCSKWLKKYLIFGNDKILIRR